MGDLADQGVSSQTKDEDDPRGPLLPDDRVDVKRDRVYLKYDQVDLECSLAPDLGYRI